MQSQAFALKDRHCKAQYAQMYFARLMELSVPVKKQAQEKWPSMTSANLSTTDALGCRQMHVHSTLLDAMFAQPAASMPDMLRREGKLNANVVTRVCA